MLELATLENTGPPKVAWACGSGEEQAVSDIKFKNIDVMIMKSQYTGQDIFY